MKQTKKPDVPQQKQSFAADNYICVLCGATGSAESLCFPRLIEK